MSFGAVISVVSAVIANSSMWTILATVAMGALSHMNAAKQRKRQAKLEKEAAARADAAKGFTLVTESTVATTGVAYGRVKLGGLRTYHNVSSNVYSGGAMVGPQIFTCAGSPSDLGSMAATANAYDLRVSLYSISDYGVERLLPGGATELRIDDWYPYYWNEGTALVSTASNADVGSSNGTVSNMRNFAVTVATTLARNGTSYRITLPDPSTHEPHMLAGARVAIRHDSFFLQPDGSPYPASQDLQSSSNVGSGYHDYTIDSYNATTGELVLTGADLTSNQLPGAAAVTFEHGKYGSHNEALFFKQVLCYEGINRVVGVEVNGVDIESDPKLDIRVHVFLDGGTPDPWLAVNFAEAATMLHHGVCHATVICWLNRDEPQFQGIPEVTFYAEGRKIFLIEYDSSYHLSNTREYSNNPALVLLDYLLDKNYGKGLAITDVDLESFYKAAKTCNRLVQVNGSFYPPGVGTYWEKSGDVRTLHLYECNLVIDTATTVRDNIEILLETMGEAELIWSDGKYKLQLLYPEPWKPTYDALSLGSFLNSNPVLIGQPTIVYTDQVVQWPDGPSADADLYVYRGLFESSSTSLPPRNTIGGTLNTGWSVFTTPITDDDILGDVDISYAGSTGNDKLNFYTVRYLNEATNWEEDSVSWPPKYDDNTTPTIEGNVYKYYLGEDQGIVLEGNTFQNGDTSYHHALSTAEGVVRSSRAASTYTFSLPRTFIKLEPGDPVRVTSEVLQIPGELMKVVELSANDEGNISLTCVKYDVRNLAWNAPDNEVVAQRNVYNTELRQATNLQFSPTAGLQIPTGGTLTWDRPDDSRVTNFLVKLTYRPIANVSDVDTAWFEVGQTASTSFLLPALDSRPLTATVVAQAADGRIAPRYNVRTGSRWPVVALVPISNYAPIVVEVLPRHVRIPQGDSDGIPGVGVATIKVTRDGVDIADEDHWYFPEWIDRETEVNPALLTEGYAYMTIPTVNGLPGKVLNISLGGNKPPRSGTLVLGVSIMGALYRRNVDFSYAGAIMTTSVQASNVSPKPVGLAVTAGIAWFMIETDDPADSFLIINPGQTLAEARMQPHYINGGYAKTEVWVASTIPGEAAPDIGDAEYLTEFVGQNTVVSAEHATTYYVWLRWVGVNGIASDLAGPVSATTGVNVTSLLRALEDKISVDQLNGALSTLVETTVPLHQTMLENVVANIGGNQYTTEVKTQILGEDLGNISQQYTVKLDANGYVSGFGLANTSSSYDGQIHSTFLVKADNFSVASPGIGASNMFTVLTQATWIDGVLVQPGIYVNNAFIHKANIDIAQIADASITTLKVAGHNITTTAKMYVTTTEFFHPPEWSGFPAYTLEASAALSATFLSTPQDVTVFIAFLGGSPNVGDDATVYLVVDDIVVGSRIVSGNGFHTVMIHYNPGAGAHTFRIGWLVGSAVSIGDGSYYITLDSFLVLATLR